MLIEIQPQLQNTITQPNCGQLWNDFVVIREFTFGFASEGSAHTEAVQSSDTERSWGRERERGRGREGSDERESLSEERREGGRGIIQSDNQSLTSPESWATSRAVIVRP